MRKSAGIIAIVLMLFFSCRQKNTDDTTHEYYVSVTGNDAASGSKASPFKTIERLNSVQLRAGDHVYFSGGETFVGTIKLDSSENGSALKPIVITSYGEGKAIIQSRNESGLITDRNSFLQVSNLCFIGSGRKDGNTKSGVNIIFSKEVTIDSLEIKGYQKAGLLIYSSHDVVVKNVLAQENGYAGISVDAEYMTYNSYNILVQKCMANGNPGDPSNKDNHSGNGIIAGYCKKVTIEYCTASDNGWDMPRIGNGPVGIWAYECDSVIIQHCISHDNKTSKGGMDGGGFDFDGGVKNSVIQHCLSYNNEGAGFGIFQYAGASEWKNNTIRNCISENDGLVSNAKANILVWNSSKDASQFRDCYFYNNTVYNDYAPAIAYAKDSEHKNFVFSKNIFVAKNDLFRDWKYERNGSVYKQNNWWSIEDGFNADGVRALANWSKKFRKEIVGDTLSGYNINPLFKAAGKTMLTSCDSLKRFDAYGTLLTEKGIGANFNK